MNARNASRTGLLVALTSALLAACGGHDDGAGMSTSTSQGDIGTNASAATAFVAAQVAHVGPSADAAEPVDTATPLATDDTQETS